MYIWKQRCDRKQAGDIRRSQLLQHAANACCKMLVMVDASWLMQAISTHLLLDTCLEGGLLVPTFC